MERSEESTAGRKLAGMTELPDALDIDNGVRRILSTPHARRMNHVFGEIRKKTELGLGPRDRNECHSVSRPAR